MMVLTETLTSAESTALTFDFTHTLQIVRFCMLSAAYFVCMFQDKIRKKWEFCLKNRDIVKKFVLRD